MECAFRTMPAFCGPPVDQLRIEPCGLSHEVVAFGEVGRHSGGDVVHVLHVRRDLDIPPRHFPAIFQATTHAAHHDPARGVPAERNIFCGARVE